MQEVRGLNRRRGSAFRLFQGVSVSSNARSEQTNSGAYSNFQARHVTILRELDQRPHGV